jgi:hypothetical protein
MRKQERRNVRKESKRKRRGRKKESKIEGV